MRPRIRSLKPEIWSDEKVGDLSHGARLLFIGLITMADDEGRLRELPTAILGHVFPYDNVGAAKLGRWLGEVERSRMIVRYVSGGKRYIAFPHWTEHQRVDKPNDSALPPPPESPNESGNGRGTDRGSISESTEDQSCSLRARASDPILSDPVVSPSQEESKPRRSPPKRVDQSALPAMPGELHHSAHMALGILQGVWEQRGGLEPTARGVGLAIAAFPDRDHVGVAHNVEHWLLAGNGREANCGDIVRRFRNFLRDTAPARPGQAASVVTLSRRERLVNDRNRFIDH